MSEQKEANGVNKHDGADANGSSSSASSASTAQPSSSSSSASESIPLPLAPPPPPGRDQQMVFFDIETNIFPIELLEYGAIIVNKFSYVEAVDPVTGASTRVSTLIHPESGGVSKKASAIHGLTYEHVRFSPVFAAVAERIFDSLHGRIWVGHNIIAFDIPHILKAFTKHQMALPVPAAIIDTLPLVRRIFGKRAGDCKMATLGAYFGLGVEKHRAVEDSEMTLQAMKCIGLHNLLEREAPLMFPKWEPEPADPSVAGAVAPAVAAAVVDTPAAAKPKKAKANKAKEVAGAPSSAAVAAVVPDSVDALANQLGKNLIINHPSASSYFVDSTLLSSPKADGNAASTSTESIVASSSASSVATASASSSSPAPKVPDPNSGWSVAHNKKQLKAERLLKEAQEAANLAFQQKQKQAAAAKAAKLKQQQQQQQQHPSPPPAAANMQRASSAESSSVRPSPPPNTWSARIAHTDAPGGPTTTEKLTRSTSGSATVTVSNHSLQAPAVSSATSAAVPVGASSAASAASSSASASVKSPTSSPRPNQSPSLRASASEFKPNTAAASMPSLSLGAVAFPTFPLVSAASPSASSSSVANPAIVSQLDYYHANPHFVCSLTYNGGQHPGSSRSLTSVQWDRRPTHFTGKVVSPTGVVGANDVFFAVTKCVQIVHVR